MSILSGPPKQLIVAGAVLSADRRYRYELTRDWDAGRRRAVFIGLNPSTADERSDDPTLRRCMRFAYDWGFGGVLLVNLFALRSTDPDALLSDPDPVGPRNDEVLAGARDAGIVVAAWGAHRAVAHRGLEVASLFGELHVLGLTKSGSPRHPLYMPASSKPVRWTPAGAV